MTFRDLLKRVKPEDYDKVIIYNDGVGWTNIDVEINKCTIDICNSDNAIFSDDK
jgi:hypothetical protein